MLVRFTVEEYDCLLNRVDPGSPAFQCLEGAVKLDDQLQTLDKYVVDCKFEMAKVLLVTARTHCPSAVEKLEAAIEELTYLGHKH